MAGCSGGGYGGGDIPEPPAPAPPAAAPSVSLTAPAGSSVNRTVQLSATVSSPSPISRVEFLVDGAVIANLTAEPFTADWDTSSVADGPHELAARVTDSAGAVVTSDAVAVAVANAPTINVSVTPAEVFPEPASTATGTGQLAFNLITGVVTGGVTLSGVTAVQAHIHAAYAGQDGPVIVNFVQSPSDPNRWDVEPGAMLTAEQVNDLLAGRLYVNVHSAAYPNGEIRGQIRPQDVTVLVTRMSGENVAPPVETTAVGLAGATVHRVGNVATIHVQSSGADDGDAAHLHVAPPAENATAALLDLTQNAAAPGQWSAEQQPITDADEASLDLGQWYADIHTPGFPGGVLRGQFEPPPTLAQLQQTIFTPMCSGCHTGGGAVLPASMDFSNAAATHAALVGVASTEKPALQRVSPGDPENSYLVHKLEGRADIVGDRMPLGAAPLDAALIAEVKAWIAAGAPE
ncbi:MAG: CHRD domain-containing protein [Steroidobacteraceae bacterium]|nr:CHRD domain-containing protein [Steroidobacteraceae bacterium]